MSFLCHVLTICMKVGAKRKPSTDYDKTMPNRRSVTIREVRG